MQNPGYDAWGICGLIILAICLIWLGINKLRDKFQKSKKTNACDYKGGGIKVLSEEDTKKYAGQNVCTVSFKDNTVVSAHLDATVAIKKAREKGYLEPVCFYVPMPGEKLIFPERSESATA